MERVHQVISNMLVTKDLDDNAFDHIYPWSENLASISWEIRASYQHTIISRPGQAVFGRDMLFSLASFIDWRVVTAAKQQQLDTDKS